MTTDYKSAPASRLHLWPSLLLWACARSYAADTLVGSQGKGGLLSLAWQAVYQLNSLFLSSVNIGDGSASCYFSCSVRRVCLLRF